MTKKLKKRIARVGVGAAIYLAGVLASHFIPQLNGNVELILFLAAYFVIGGDVVKTAAQNIGHGQIFDENFLMTVATVGAFLVGDYPEAVAVMLFYQVGECFQSYAVNRSRKSIKDLMDIRPDYANVMRDGALCTVDPEEVLPGESIVVKPGERIPLDGVVTEGSTSLDTAALTGESLPREAEAGDQVISGCVNLSGVITVKVEREFGESTVSRILELVENAADKKAEAENFITRFARYYTPVVVGCALLLAVVPPLIAGGDWNSWIYRALTFLVISCPCALVISIPLSFFGGLGGASRAGVLVKGSNYLEALSKAQIVVMDKTGTLTKGSFAVTGVYPAEGVSEEDFAWLDHGRGEEKEKGVPGRLLEIAACAENYSTHPISQSLLAAYGGQVDRSRLSEVRETAGHGVRALLDGTEVCVGNGRLMAAEGIGVPEAEETGTVVYVAAEGRYLGRIIIEDEVKPDAGEAVSQLRKAGVEKIVMLTGDRKGTANRVAAQVGITEVRAELLPGDKVEEVEKLIGEKSPKGKLIFVGDGINDAPVLARADIGIAMGGLGSDAAIEAADVVIMTDEPSKIALAMKIAGKTLNIVKQNIVFAIGVKVLVLLLAAAGIANMWAAVFSDVGVAVIAILNAMRAMGKKRR